MDDLGFVETVDGFGESIVVAVADAAYRRLDTRFRQALGVFDRDVLAAPDALLFVKRRFGWR
jgi:type IV secretory pathway TrbF-like protein